MEINKKILKSKVNDKFSRQIIKLDGNSMVEGSMSNFPSDTHDPANVISFGGTLENTMDKDQIAQIKQFVRDSRKYEGPMGTKKEILDLIDSNANAYSQFNTLTKIKYFYLKHEWTFIAIRECTAIIVIILSFVLYSSSLKVEKNYHNYNMYFYYPMTLSSLLECISSGIIIGFIIFFMYRKWVFLEHLVYIIIVYLILIYNNHGSNILNHGKFNLVIFSMTSIVVFLTLLSIHLIYKFSRTIKFLYIILAVIYLFLGFLLCYNFKDKYEQVYTCDKWGRTLNSSYISDSSKDDKCNHIELPKGLCYMDKIFNYFDLTLVNNIKCSIRNETESLNFYNFIKNRNFSDSKIFAFPKTNHINFKNENETISEYVLNNIIDLDNKTEEEGISPPETILDFSSNKYGELKIQITKNTTLSEERKKIAEKNKNTSIYDNVFIIFLSSTSRAHFQRAMPKLSKFISSLMEYRPFPTMTAYEFAKYASSADNISLIFNKLYENETYDSNSLKYFKENGFVTGQVIDKCEKEDDPSGGWDHENFAYLCDPNYFKKENSIYERCLYGRPVSHYMINYAINFWDKYSDNKKYFRMIFNYGNEPTGNVLTYLDEPLYDMVSHLYNNGKLKNTALFFLSEKGNKNDGLYDLLGSAEFHKEKNYGVFIMILDWNDKFKSGNYYTNLIENQNLIVTPYDIYETIIHIALGNNKNDTKDNEEESVLNKINKNRFCEKKIRIHRDIYF